MINELLGYLPNQIAYSLLALWLIFSILYSIKAYRKPKEINPYIFDNLPSVFTTLGIFGTFLGIAFGLWKFNVNDIDGSIPELLNGLKTAFVTSIVGISFSLVFSKIVEGISYSTEQKEETQFDLLSAVNKLIEISRENTNSMSEKFDTLIDVSINQNENYQNLATQNASNFEKLRTELSGHYEKLSNEFEKFANVLGEINTEAMVKSIEKALSGFNERFNELIERLVKENFEELNQSVLKLNDWQQEHKEQVDTLTNQFTEITSNIEKSSQNMLSISQATDSLVNNDGKLAQLIEELQNVLIEENTFTNLNEKLTKTVNELFETGNKLNQYVTHQNNLKDAVYELIQQLDQFKDFNSDVWDNYRTEMQKAINIVKDNSRKLANDIDEREEMFYERLSTTFKTLDTIMQELVNHH